MPGRISISTRSNRDWVVICVTDNGPGIPSSIHSRIFDPFFTTKDPGKATGQGLSIAHATIVAKHRGTLTFQSEEGHSTTFTIQLPRDAEATQDPADMAANAYTKELMMSMSTNDRQLLEMIDAALVRIEDGQYGKCIHCSQPIQEKRLEAVPWALHCLRCADLNERGLLIREEE